MLAAGFVLPLGIHFRDMDRSDNLYALRYGEELLDRLPERAALFTVDGHALFILWYLIYCENRRPDLMVIEPTWLSAGSGLRSQVLEQYPDLALPGPEHVAARLSGVTDPERKMDFTIQAVLDANYDLRPIYWGIVSRELPFSRNLIPQGIVYRYAAEPVTMDDEIVSLNRVFWEAELDFLSRNPAMKRDTLALEIYPVELNNQGLLFEGFGREDLAMWATKLALEFNPEYPISRYNLARLHARAGRHEEAIQEYRRAVRGNPYMAVAYYGLGNAYKNVGRLDEAFLAYRQATRMYPAYHEALTAMGQLYALVGQNEDAAEKFREALNVEPTYTFALRGLGSAYLKMERLDEAKEALDRALQIEPESAPGLFALAKYYVYIGNEAEAAGTLQRSVEIGGTAFLTEALTDEHLKEVAAGLSVGDGGE
jgi:Flp pilus assembly protein TadD